MILGKRLRAPDSSLGREGQHKSIKKYIQLIILSVFVFTFLLLQNITSYATIFYEYTFGHVGYERVESRIEGNDVIITFYNFYAPFKLFAKGQYKGGTRAMSSLDIELENNTDKKYTYYVSLTNTNDNISYCSPKVVTGTYRSRFATMYMEAEYAQSSYWQSKYSISDIHIRAYHEVTEILGDLQITVKDAAAEDTINFLVYTRMAGTWNETFQGNVIYWTDPETYDKPLTYNRHTHNQDGRYYEQVNDTQHRVYKYCNEHDGSRDYNNDGGTLENHSWTVTRDWYNGGSVEKQDQRCSTCGRTRTMTRDHTYNEHYACEGRPTNTSYAQHNVYHYYTCKTCDSRYDATPARYTENCYDADDNGYCDFCGRHRRWVNINVNTPDGDEDASGNTARFNMSWHDNTALGEQQNHWEGQVSDQKNGNVWVGTTIWIDNINISQSYLYLTGVTGATKSGDSYYYVVQDEEHEININTDYKSYSLTINPNGGTLNVTDDSIKKNSNGIATATVKYNQTWYCNLGVTASREHYTMDGFYTSASGGTRLWDNGGTCYVGNGYWNSSRKWCYAGNVTVYAHWSDAPGYHNGQAIVYNLTYSITPKTGATSVRDPGNPTTYTIETPTFILKEPSAKGYIFEGWIGTNANKSKDVTIYQGSIGNRSFEAQWSDAAGYHNGKAIVYTITYTLYPKNGSNIGITDPGNPTTYTIETPTFTLKNPSATNYSFEGWYSSGTNGSKGVTIKQGSIGDLHFEADWLPTKDSSKGDGHDQNLPYVKTTEIKENTVKIAA